VAMALNFGSYWFSDKIVLSVHHARPVSRADAPELHAMLDRICSRAGIPVPRLYILPQEQRATMVGALKIVDRALVGDSEDLFKLLPIIKPDVITLGFDQDISEEWLEDRLNRLGMQIKVIRIKKHLRGRFFSTSKILEAACRETKIKG
ncbi:MAG: hypothetical protein ABIN58_09280, partial [candidate division WOR-3 bacterium]